MVVNPIICDPGLEEDPHPLCVEIVRVFSHIQQCIQFNDESLIGFWWIKITRIGNKVGQHGM
jgi:hypothetical protein